jgi:hypothetical protein
MRTTGLQLPEPTNNIRCYLLQEAVRVTICHTATVIANGYMHSGTTHDQFLRLIFHNSLLFPIPAEFARLFVNAVPYRTSWKLLTLARSIYVFEVERNGNAFFSNVVKFTRIHVSDRGCYRVSLRYLIYIVVLSP